MRGSAVMDQAAEEASLEKSWLHWWESWNSYCSITLLIVKLDWFKAEAGLLLKF